MALSGVLWQLTAMGFVFAILMGVQAGLPLGSGGLRTDPSILSDGYTVSIRTVIFSMQGVATLLPWPLDVKTSRTAVFVHRIWWLWICTWMSEIAFTIVQYIMQSNNPAEMPVAGLLFAALALLSGYLFMSLALRRVVLKLRAKAKQALDDTSIPLIQLAVVGILLYIIPSAVHAGWLGLASCVTVIQLAAAFGASYDALTIASIVLLILVSLTTLTQPWILRPGLPYFHSYGTHLPKDADKQQRQQAESRKMRSILTYWAGFVLASTAYAIPIWRGILQQPSNDQPQSLGKTIAVLTSILGWVGGIGPLLRHFVDSNFNLQAAHLYKGCHKPLKQTDQSMEVEDESNDESCRLLEQDPAKSGCSVYIQLPDV